MLLQFFARDFSSLLSETGIDFLTTFGTSKDQAILKEVRKLYVNYKHRDSIMVETKKSIVYSLITKCVVTLYQADQDKVMRLLDIPTVELTKEMQNEQAGLDKLISVEQYARVKLIGNFVKVFLNSIMLIVAQQSKQNPAAG